MTRLPIPCAAALLALLGAACAPAAVNVAPALPEPGSGGLLAPERIAALPPEQSIAWRRYLDTSAGHAEHDRRTMDAELAAAGLREPTPAPPARGRIIRESKPDDWYGGDEARRVADAVVSFQTPSGGWSKNLDYRAAPRRSGQSFAAEGGWRYIGTFDNDATVDELRFLARVHSAQPQPHFREAILRGLEYTLAAQYPTGCWPQVYPLQGGYHDAATYNDEAIPNILQLLRDVERGALPFVPDSLRQRAAVAVRSGIECILATQVVVDGRLTAWGQQHDPLGHAPVPARAYEHAALTAAESIDVIEFLMSIENPDRRVVDAVESAVAWLREAAIHDTAWEDRALVERPGAGPIWARLYEIGTNRPIFGNRDGSVLYDIEHVHPERLHGYAWYGTWPARVLSRYEQWARRHHAAAPAGGVESRHRQNR